MRFGGMVFGLVFVLIGAALLFDKLDTTGSDNIIGDYWPVILIALGFLGWVGKGLRPELGSMVLMTLGGILLTQNLSDDYSFVDLWPALAIAIGLAIIFGSGSRRKGKHGFGMRFEGGGKRWKNRNRCSSPNDSDTFFAGGSRLVDGEYSGSRARVRLGSDGIDLTQATMPEGGSTLTLDIVLGEYKIRVPRQWKVNLVADITMAEVNDHRSPAQEERTGPTLDIDGKVMMGSVELSD